MSEEWSLKDCWRYVDVYTGKDIETLHEKLVDLVYKSLMEEENPEWVILQINKLFGVE